MFFSTQLCIGNALFALRQSNLPGQVIILVLLGWSVYAWTIMVNKNRQLRSADRQTKEFISLFRRESDPITLFLRRRSFAGTPVYKIYEQGCLAIGGELDNIENVKSAELLTQHWGNEVNELTPRQFELIRNSVERTVTDEAMMIENNMGALANAVSTCPFLGLLGTVWGVMDAFGGMAVTGSATLSAVAPGISGALLTTIVALLVAIPSAVGYNNLTTKIRKLQVEMDNFAQEFIAAVQRQYISEQ